MSLRANQEVKMKHKAALYSFLSILISTNLYALNEEPRGNSIFASATKYCAARGQLLKLATEEATSLANEACSHFGSLNEAKVLKVKTLKIQEFGCWDGIPDSISIEMRYRCIHRW